MKVEIWGHGLRLAFSLTPVGSGLGSKSEHLRRWDKLKFRPGIRSCVDIQYCGYSLAREHTSVHSNRWNYSDPDDFLCLLQFNTPNSGRIPSEGTEASIVNVTPVITELAVFQGQCRILLWNRTLERIRARSRINTHITHTYTSDTHPQTACPLLTTHFKHFVFFPRKWVL